MQELMRFSAFYNLLFSLRLQGGGLAAPKCVTELVVVLNLHVYAYVCFIFHLLLKNGETTQN